MAGANRPIGLGIRAHCGPLAGGAKVFVLSEKRVSLATVVNCDDLAPWCGRERQRPITAAAGGRRVATPVVSDCWSLLGRLVLRR